jgi:nucleoside-diphosphate-sugar epimerase
MWVKRVLDRRRVAVLAHGGRAGDHTTAAANIAALVEACAARPGARVLNSADPDAPSGLEIARTIARLLDHEFDEVLLDGPPVGSVGRDAWSVFPPVVLDTTAARALGYEPVGDYAATVADEVEWVLAHPPRTDDPFFAPLLDYVAEDRWLAAR